jgi:hypothetical protein
VTITLGAVFGPARSFPGTSQALSFGTVTAGQLVTFPVVYWNPVGVDTLTASDVTASGTATISPLSVDRQDGIQADTSVWLRTAVYSCVVRTGGTLTLTLAGLQAGAAPTVFGATYNATQGWSEIPAFRLDGAGAGAATASNGLTSWASGSATSTATSDRNSVHIGVLAWNAGVNSLLTITGGLFSSIGVENDGTSFEPGAASYLIDTTATSADASWSGVMSGAATEGASATQVIYREGQGWNKSGTGPKLVANLGHPFGAGAVESFFRGVASGGGSSVPLTGVSATGAVGSLGVTVSRALTGNAATGAVGTLTASISKALTGNAATGAVGSLTPSISVALTGVSATGQVGNLTANATVSLSGVVGTGAVGTVTPTSDTLVALSGVSATGAVGSLGVNVSAALSGVAATGAVGSLTPTISAALSGVSATGAVGTLTPVITVALTGVSATGQVGDLTPAAAGAVALTGVSATGAVGDLLPTITVALTGVQATGQVGNLSTGAPVADGASGLGDYASTVIAKRRQAELDRQLERQRQAQRAAEEEVEQRERALVRARSEKTKERERARLAKAQEQQAEQARLVELIAQELAALMAAERRGAPLSAATLDADEEDALVLLLLA